MNEENIKKLVEFIKNHASYPENTLREAAKDAGLNKDEFETALKLSGVKLPIPPPATNTVLNTAGEAKEPSASTTLPSAHNAPSAPVPPAPTSPSANQPLIQPSPQPSAQEPLNTSSLTSEHIVKGGGSKNLIIIVVLCLALITTVSIGYYYLSVNNILPFLNPAVQPAPEVPELPGSDVTLAPLPTKPITPASSESAKITGPLADFFTALSAGNYKITTTGKFENKVVTGESTESTTLDLNNGIIYVEKGNVVKIDKQDAVKPQSVILKDSQVVTIDPVKKTYSVVSVTDEMGQFLVKTMNSSLPLIPLYQDVKAGKTVFVKNEEGQWIADWKWAGVLGDEEIPVKVKVIADPTTNLIPTLSMQFKEGENWQDGVFVYEKVADLTNILSVPAGYAEAATPTP